MTSHLGPREGGSPGSECPTPFGVSDQVLPSLFSHSFLPSLGTYIPQAAGMALHPHEWRHSRQKSSTPPADPRKSYPYMDGSFSEDDWDKPSRYGEVGGGREVFGSMGDTAQAQG